jgi:SAM-dependent methyltransferase
MKDYFKDDEYWKKHKNDELEDDLWINDYKEYLSTGICLDLGCGIGQYSKWFMENGYEVISSDISKIALKKVKEFNNNVVYLDMREKLPFEDNKFDVVFANLSIHYFSDSDTKDLMNEIKRILKKDGLFIGSVNGMQGLNVIKDTAKELEHHYYYNIDKYIRLFDIEDIKNYLNVFDIIKIDERETIRFEKKKNYIIFIANKR